MKFLPALLLFAACASTTTEPTPSVPPANRLEQHAWLDQLLGDWRVSSESIMEPGGEPVFWEFEESVRSVGGLWVVSEGSADYDGQPFTSRMTLGYDPLRETFVGSWIDSIQTTMWTYVGHLEDSGRVLTLEAEGPSMTDPTQTAEYRDQIEIISPNVRRMVSSMAGEDGSWTTFMTSTARRVK